MESTVRTFRVRSPHKPFLLQHSLQLLIPQSGSGNYNKLAKVTLLVVLICLVNKLQRKLELVLGRRDINRYQPRPYHLNLM